MPKFSQALSEFRSMVKQRSTTPRKSSFEDLVAVDTSVEEHLRVGGREATIHTIVLPLPSGGIQVVVQGFVKARLVGKHVAADGFYKYLDQTSAAMSNEDLWDFS